jgi:excisionase family DNA binding protein
LRPVCILQGSQEDLDHAWLLICQDELSAAAGAAASIAHDAGAPVLPRSALAMSALPAAPLTVKDVAALASVHEHTVRRAIHDGHLEAFRRLGSTVYAIHPDAFERWAYGERVAPRADAADVPASRSTAATAAGNPARLQAIERGEAASWLTSR